MDGLAGFQRFDVFGQQRPFDGIGVIEIDEFPFLPGHMAAVVVVGILRNHAHLVVGQVFNDFTYHGGLS
ncbi:MAG: hypothetical protein BWY72_00390 [Bacteroidetes bacterium ADurb.Bin416]|nr:MAG: hypothetical protein BWY72_00390 [Bacteroidetes bacterium ADurb.Bin416]